MDRKRLFKTLASLIIPLFLINYIAVRLYWYYSIWWFDMPMHFLGGFCVGLGLIWFFGEINEKLILKIILGVSIIGISWELFEIVFYQIIAQIPFSLLDSASDVFFDLAGGAFALVYFLKNYLKSKK